MRLAAALGGLALALAACGGDGTPARPAAGPAPAGTERRLDWTPVGPPEPRAARSLLRLDVPADIAGWRVGAEAARLRGEPPERALVLLGQGEKVVRVPVRLDPTSFDQVAVRFQVDGNDFVGVRLLRGEEELARSRFPSVHGATEEQVVVLDLPGTRELARTPADGLELHVHGSGGRFALLGLELLDRPPAAWLPDPDGEPELLEIEGRSRRVVGLSSTRPMELELAPPPASRLGVSFARPPELAGSAPCELVLTLSAGGDVLATAREPVAASWRRLELDLAAHAGRELRVRAELVAAGGGPAHAALGQPVLSARSERPRTVLLVTSDTHRQDHLGLSAGGVDIATPALDALAARGAFFADCFASSNFTIPSHVALFTATTPRDTGVLDNFSRVSAAAETLAERFQDAGFRTFASLSARLLGVSGLGQGFDRFAVPDRVEWRASDAVERALGWLEEAEGSDLFLWLHVFDAHSPYEPPPPYDVAYWPADRDPADPSLPSPDLPGEFLERLAPGLRDLGFLAAQYRGEVSYLDAELGRLLAHPRLSGAAIAVTADHGESLGQHGVFWGHEELYPDTIHVPLIVAGPGVPAGRRAEAPVRQIDVGRTLLDMAGLEAVEFPGVDLRRFLGASPPDVAGEPRFAISNDASSASITLDGWHLMLQLTDHHPEHLLEARRRHELELYHLPSDPGCARDLALERRDLARELRGRLGAWLADAGPGLAARGPGDRETLEELALLGYVEPETPLVDPPRYDPDCGCAACRRYE